MHFVRTQATKAVSAPEVELDALVSTTIGSWRVTCCVSTLGVDQGAASCRLVSWLGASVCSVGKGVSSVDDWSSTYPDLKVSRGRRVAVGLNLFVAEAIESFVALDQ